MCVDKGENTMDLNKLLNFSALAGIVGAVSACIADVLAIIPMWTTDGEGMFGVSDAFFVFLLLILFILPCTIYILIQIKTEIAVLRSVRGKGESMSRGILRKYVMNTGGRCFFVLLYAGILYIGAKATQLYALLVFAIICLIGFILSFALKMIAYKRLN